MAIARPQAVAAGSSAGLKVAAIAFAVVAVVSITFTVIFFTQKADLIAEADRQKQAAGRASKDAREKENAYQTLALAVIDDSPETPAQAEEALGRMRDRVRDLQLPQSELNVDQSVSRMVDQLVSALGVRIDELARLQQEQTDLKQQLDDAIAANEKRAQDFDARIAELKDLHDKLGQDAEAFRAEANSKIEALQRQRDAELEGIAAERDAERQLREGAEAALTHERDRIDKLMAQLAEYKPGSEGGSVLQFKDGDVIRVVPGNEVVYVNLGQRDGLKAGMTFSVYSPVRGIPADGKGKATIEVVEVAETTSQCRVTTRAKADPVLTGDVVANPVFDRAQQFNFVVAGDFDLNFDGEIDDPGGQEVARLIRHWGGTTLPQVDTAADFVVLGAPPPKPLPAAAIGDDANAAARSAELTRQNEAFEAVKQEALSLSIPILTRTQFLHFLGYGVPRNVADDPPAM